MKRMKWLALLLVLFLWGCNSKLTQENYNKIGMGMGYDQVVDLIGKPDKCDDVMGIRSCHWGDGKTAVSISFAGDKVLLFSAENLH